MKPGQSSRIIHDPWPNDVSNDCIQVMWRPENEKTSDCTQIVTDKPKLTADNKHEIGIDLPEFLVTFELLNLLVAVSKSHDILN